MTKGSILSRKCIRNKRIHWIKKNIESLVIPHLSRRKGFLRYFISFANSQDRLITSEPIIK